MMRAKKGACSGFSRSVERRPRLSLRRRGMPPVVVLPLGQAEPIQRQLAENLPLAKSGKLVGQQEAIERALKVQVGRVHGAVPAQMSQSRPADVFVGATCDPMWGSGHNMKSRQESLEPEGSPRGIRIPLRFRGLKQGKSRGRTR
jgi:hypothetical protein